MEGNVADLRKNIIFITLTQRGNINTLINSPCTQRIWRYSNTFLDRDNTEFCNLIKIQEVLFTKAVDFLILQMKDIVIPFPRTFYIVFLETMRFRMGPDFYASFTHRSNSCSYLKKVQGELLGWKIKNIILQSKRDYYITFRNINTLLLID